MGDRVVITFLEMLDPSWLVPAADEARFEMRRVGEPCPALNRFFYLEVGRGWRWTERLRWSDDDWAHWATRDGLATWIGWIDGNPIGYAELGDDGDGGLEIVYFGLLPQFIGRGHGSIMLTRVIERAWAEAPSRIWLHTCTYDHPAALTNYERRGFRRYREEVVEPATAAE